MENMLFKLLHSSSGNQNQNTEDQHSVEHFAVVRLIDHSATHFQEYWNTDYRKS